MAKVLPALLVAAVLLAGGCSGFNPPPRPAVVAHLDVTQKQAYIRSTESALKSFRAVAADLSRSHNPHAQADLGKEVNGFVKLGSSRSSTISRSGITRRPAWRSPSCSCCLARSTWTWRNTGTPGCC